MSELNWLKNVSNCEWLELAQDCVQWWHSAVRFCYKCKPLLRQCFSDEAASLHNATTSTSPSRSGNFITRATRGSARAFHNRRYPLAMPWLQQADRLDGGKHSPRTLGLWKLNKIQCVVSTLLFKSQVLGASQSCNFCFGFGLILLS
jgi:hypothetical protein